MTVKYETILTCTDFSEDADYALQVAWDLAQRHQARWYCLHVLHSVYRFFPDPEDTAAKSKEGAPFPSDLLEKAREKLQEYCKTRLKDAEREPTFEVVWGVPFVEIVRFARSRKVDCIVLGAAGASNIRRIAYGSTAENVARRAHCTVIITRDPKKGY